MDLTTGRTSDRPVYLQNIMRLATNFLQINAQSRLAGDGAF